MSASQKPSRISALQEKLLRPKSDDDGLIAAQFRHYFGFPISVDESRDVCELSISLVNFITMNLPLNDPASLQHTQEVSQRVYFAAQTGAHRIEKLLNPKQHPFGSEARERHFCRHCAAKLRKAAKRVLGA